jgi:hypothetical protein
VLIYTDAFWIVIAFNLPAVLFLLVVLGFSYQRNGQSALLVIACALVLSLIAALLQQLEVGFHAIYFNHNVLYHLLQAIMLYLFFWGGRRLCDTEIGWQRASATMGAQAFSIDNDEISTTPGV